MRSMKRLSTRPWNAPCSKRSASSIITCPAAATSFGLFIVNCIASIWYLWKRSPKADAIGRCRRRSRRCLLWRRAYHRAHLGAYAWGTFWVWDARLTTTLLLWLLYISYLILRKALELDQPAVLAGSWLSIASLDMPIVYMSNRWFRTNHPQPMIGTPNLNHDMQTVLLWNMLAFCMFAILIAWFRFELERTSQAINQMHIRKAAQGVSMAMILPAPGIFLAAKPAMLLLARKALLFGSVALLWLDSDADSLAHEKLVQHHYMVAGYIAVWTIYIGYLLFLFNKLRKLHQEEAELRASEKKIFSPA